MTAPRRLRVAFDATIFGHQRYGGVSRYFVELHRALSADSTVDARLLAGLHANGYIDRSVPGTFGAFGNRLPSRFRTKVGDVNSWMMDRAAARLAPDVIHRTTFRLPDIPAAPTVITVYDFIHDLFPGYYEDDEYARRQTDAIRRADGIICISDSTRRDLQHFVPGLTTPTVVSHLATSGPTPSPVELESLTRLRVEGSPKRLLYVGSRFGYKSFDLLIDALSLIESGEPWQLVCIGEQLSDGERDHLASAGVAASRVSASSATDAELIHHYRSAAALVYPSAYEGFGLPVVEAMSQGCPVICDRNSSLPEVAGDAAMYLAERSPSALASLIDRCLALSYDEMFEQSSAAWMQARRFSWERTAAEHLALYRSLVG